jgi:hypothetical protein
MAVDVTRISTLFRDRRSRRAVVGASAAAVIAATGVARAQDATPEPAATPGGTPVTPDGTPAAARQADDPSFLFVQSFGSGTLAPADGEAGRYTLTLAEGLGQTVAFSDRPERTVGAVPTGDWLSSFPFGDADPPNAALVTQTDETDTDVLIMELRQPRYDSDTRTATYDAQLLRDYERLGITFQQEPADGSAVPASFGAASLFIDDCPDFHNCIYVSAPGYDHVLGVIGPLPGGSVSSCWDWDDGCVPCHGSVADLNGQCNATYPDCDDNCTPG